jgi:hypothetical protein
MGSCVCSMGGSFLSKMGELRSSATDGLIWGSMVRS